MLSTLVLSNENRLFAFARKEAPTSLGGGGCHLQLIMSMKKNIKKHLLLACANLLNIKYMDLGEYYFHDDKIDENYDTKTQVAKIRNRAIEFKLKKNQKVIRLVAMKEFKNYMAKPEGKLRLGLVTHTTSKKKHK